MSDTDRSGRLRAGTPADPIISVEVLRRRLGSPDVRVVDVRWYLGRPGDGRAAYAAGHIPGAVYLDVDGDLSDPPAGPNGGRHPLPDPIAFRRRLEAAGIGDEHMVVAYDDCGGWVAARLWWMLDDLGHAGVAVLDGGFPAWTTAGLPVSTDVASPMVASLTLHDQWTRVIDRDALRARLGSIDLLDARAGERYRGETEPIDPAAGHIPTAWSAPTAGNLAPDGRFLSAEALAERFHDLGVGATADDDATPVVTYCGSGVSATHHALVMRRAGLADPLLYPGSWSDWSSAGFPVATGPTPGDPS